MKAIEIIELSIIAAIAVINVIAIAEQFFV